MKLWDFIETKVIQKLAEAREDDMEKLHTANEVFENVVSFVESLDQDVEKFRKRFIKEKGGKFVGIKLDRLLPSMPEIKAMTVYFLDYEMSGVKKTVKAKAGRTIEDNKLINVHVSLFFEAPATAKKTTLTYNRWLAKNLADILQDSKYRSSFVHEFTHTLDFRRINPEYLVARTKQKIAEKEANVKKDRDKYINDPLELNAYYQQAMSDLYNKLLETETVDEWNNLVGSTPQEFADNLLANLRPQVQKRLNPENIKRFMKRAATAWEYVRLI
jgi:hypothetical protein